MLHIYNASAGSGKTYTLAHEYLRLLLQDTQATDDKRLPHSRILAVTFTKKATAEMKERILYELYLLSKTPEKSQHWGALLQELGISSHEIQQRASHLLIGILQDYSRFSISTIDGFFQQVIRTFAHELGLSATYDLSLDGEEMIQEAVDEIYKRIREEHSEDKELIQWMIEFIQKNIDDDHKWNPNDTIKLFSKQLLREQLTIRMPELQKIFDDKDFMRKYRSTLQSICQTTEEQVAALLYQANCIFQQEVEEKWNKHILTAFKKSPAEWLKGEMGATFNNVIADPIKIITKSKTTKAEQTYFLDLYNQKLEPIFQQINDICASSAAKDYVTAKEILPHLYTLGILQDVAKQIETTNRNIGRLPISETNQLVNQIIDGQEAPFIYERYGQYFRHYMIDEFQDTSALQWKNFTPLIHESESYQVDNLIVGDVKQSIYRFRNSDWSLLKHIPEQFSNHLSYCMPNNWRTAPVIIQENEKLMQAFSNHVAGNICERYDQDNLGTDIAYIFHPDYMHQEPAKTDDGYFHMQFFKDNNAEEQALEQLHIQLQALQQEGIDLKRVTMLVRYTSQAALLAQFLINHGYNVQSSEGLQIGSHPVIQLLINLLKQEDKTIEPIHEAYIRQRYGELTEEQQIGILHAQQLPLYEQVQQLIDLLQLSQQKDVTPYLTAFQDTIYQFTKSRVANRKAFLEFWERKGKNKTIAAPQTADAIRIMTIHSSKGLEFDIVFIPFFTWEITKTRQNDIIWCEPQTPPFNQLPLVAVHPSKNLLNSHFRNEYIQEQIAQSIDNLNLTYVAITRPKYRLYIYAQLTRKTSGSVGAAVYALYQDLLNDQLTYCVPQSGEPAPLPPLKEEQTLTYPAEYISQPINQRLILRSRAEDDFAQDTPLATVDLGILMHLWLSRIRTWQDAEPALLRLVREGQVTDNQANEMRQQLTQLQALIQRHNHNDWFTNTYRILAEQDIITPAGNMQRPDRVMIKDNHAIVIDYKFGQEQPKSHLEQVRDYMLLLQQMGYTTEGHIIYVALQTIHSIPQ